MAASAKITNRDLPSQVGSVGKLKRVCMLKEPNVYVRYVCMFAKHVCMFAVLVCMFAKLVCMGVCQCTYVWKNHAPEDEVRFLRKNVQNL